MPITNSTLASAAESTLLFIDVQIRLVAAMDPAISRAVLHNAQILLKSASCLGIPVLATEQYPKGLGGTVPELASLLSAANPPIEKTSFSCAGAESFSTALAATGRSQVILAGTESHVCVLQSALDLLAAGKTVFVVEDATCARSVANHVNAMERLRRAGVTVTNSESVVFEWLKDARNDKFKPLSALLRAHD
jgi:nicotinamidase-related amidase